MPFIADSMCVGEASEIDILFDYDARPCGMSGFFDTDTHAPCKGYYDFYESALIFSILTL